MQRKIALFANVDVNAVIEAPDAETIYEVPLQLHAQHLDDLVLEKLGLEAPRPQLGEWRALVERVKQPGNGTVRIAVVGKYVALVDSYKSVQEALFHGGIANDVGVEIDWLSSEDFENGAGVGAARGLPRPAHPGRLRGAGRGGDARRHPLGARERAALLRDLPGPADGDHRVLAQRLRAAHGPLGRVGGGDGATR